MKINGEWHRANKLARNATLEQRIAWHLEHEANCACRPMPKSIADELVARRAFAPDVSIEKQPLETAEAN